MTGARRLFVAMLRLGLLALIIAGAVVWPPLAMPPPPLEVTASSIDHASGVGTHSHDEAYAHGSSDHAQKHNPADHSHETLSTPPAFPSLKPVTLSAWNWSRAASATPDTRFRLDRPPRARRPA